MAAGSSRSHTGVKIGSEMVGSRHDRALDLDAGGYVPWWDEDVPLFNAMVHRLSDATRHAGHDDILREGLDGAVGVDADTLPLHGRDRSFWEARRAEIERVAQVVNPA